jgi:hypothetical protein
MDLHLFENYWSYPPPSKKIMNSKRQKVNKQNKTSDPAPEISNLATPTTINPSDQAPPNNSELANNDSNLPSEQPQGNVTKHISNKSQEMNMLTHDTKNSELAIPSDLALPDPPTIEATTSDSSSTFQWVSSNKPKVQLFHAHQCSVQFDQYKQSEGIDAAVYTAISSHHNSQVPTTPSSPHNFISLLTYGCNPDTLPFTPQG